MVGFVVVTRAALLIARRASTWTIDEHLGGRIARLCRGRPPRPGARVLRNCWCRSLPKPRQRPDLGTGRTGHRARDYQGGRRGSRGAG